MEGRGPVPKSTRQDDGEEKGSKSAPEYSTGVAVQNCSKKTKGVPVIDQMAPSQLEIFN